MDDERIRVLRGRLRFSAPHCNWVMTRDTPVAQEGLGTTCFIHVWSDEGVEHIATAILVCTLSARVTYDLKDRRGMIHQLPESASVIDGPDGNTVTMNTAYGNAIVIWPTSTLTNPSEWGRASLIHGTKTTAADDIGKDYMLCFDASELARRYPGREIFAFPLKHFEQPAMQKWAQGPEQLLA